MIIVVLLFFQSLCLYLQNIVLKVHDKWLNPKHARLLIDKEQRRLQLFALKPKYPVPGCKFCSNSPLGYCRHHNPNQPTLRHLKNRLLVKGGTTASAAIGSGAIGIDEGGGNSILSPSSVTSSSSPSSSSVCETVASYLDRKDPDKVCTCLSCTHGESRNASTSHPRRNRTSWGTRNGTVIWGERVVIDKKTQSHLNGEDNGTEIVAPKRRRRRYEKYGGFY